MRAKTPNLKLAKQNKDKTKQNAKDDYLFPVLMFKTLSLLPFLQNHHKNK